MCSGNLIKRSMNAHSDDSVGTFQNLGFVHSPDEVTQMLARIRKTPWFNKYNSTALIFSKVTLEHGWVALRPVGMSPFQPPYDRRITQSIYQTNLNLRRFRAEESIHLKLLTPAFLILDNDHI